MDQFVCSLCAHFSATSVGGVLRHVGAIHAHDPLFQLVCGINGCPRTYKNYYSFRKHLRRRHAEYLDQDLDTSGQSQVCADEDLLSGIDNCAQLSAEYCPEARGALVNQELSRRIGAMFLLKTKEVNGVSQTALNEMIEDVSLLVQTTLDTVKAKVEAVLAEKGVDSQGLAKIFEVEWLRNPFRGLHSDFLQQRTYEELFGLVKPVARKLGATLKRKLKNGRMQYQLSAEFVYDVPLLLSLKQLLSNDFIFSEVMRGHQRGDHLIGDFCDAASYKNHPLFSQNHQALQVMLYYDDLEVCNPIGSRAKIHKVGIFYYTLGNISPEFRSSTKMIQLLAVVKHSVLKSYGIDRVLQPFMDDIHALEQEAGVDFNINGKVYNFRGTISLVCADNLAAWDIGGYKALASALRKCQFCMAIVSDMASKFLSESFQPRTRQTHALHCQDLGGPLHEHIATTYGVQRDAILNTSKYFHVTEGLTPDIMHDILEGCLEYETKELLKYLILERKLFTLDDLNSRISNFPYFYTDATDKPIAISSASLLSSDHALKQSASQMWCLSRLLPLMIGEMVSEQDPKWENFLLMLTITDYAFAPVTSEEIIPYLKSLIRDHHEAFKELYPNCPIIPKMHYLIHLPEWLLRLGPAIRYWCMRFESKHSYFKSLAHRVKCFKNIAKTLANRHQAMMCYYLSGDSTKFAKDAEYGRVRNRVCICDYKYKDELAMSVTNISTNEELCSVSWARIGGTLYKQQAIVVLESDLLPVFAQIVDIIVYGVDHCLFVCHLLVTHCFVNHFHSFEIQHQESPVVKLVKQTELVDHHPLGQYSLPSYSSSKFISLKYHLIECV